MPKIKICGLRRARDVAYVNEAGPDYVGFVFAPSRRRVSPFEAEGLRAGLRDGIVPVGVFVNASPDDVAALYRAGVIELAQLHGGEDEAYIAALKVLCGVPVIRAVRMDRQDVPADTGADYLLLDGGAGGLGQGFDWGRIPSGGKPFFLAGGITVDNIRAATALRPYAIDVSSGAETDGEKDREKVLALVAAARRELRIKN
ncbi:MAG: phosphoribosylanthranilate isomerase [Oscillospiraceae bacterium]|jgi:phosphoribosylanthranilate isomerase|nr:phosphoribosylanthranilate isomerase [Oscillospiraceae bacterium]